MRRIWRRYGESGQGRGTYYLDNLFILFGLQANFVYLRAVNGTWSGWPLAGFRGRIT
jgi:hypothetical protein